MATLPDLPTPAQFNALRVTSSDPACTVLQNYVKMIQLVADLVGNIYNPDGSFTQAFIDKICATGCAGGGSGSSTTGASSSVSLYVSSQFVISAENRYGGRFFYVDTSTWTYQTINGDMRNGALTQVVLGVSVRKSDGVVFVIYIEMPSFPTASMDLKLGTINTSTGAITGIGVVFAASESQAEYSNYSLAFGQSGTLYMGSRLGGPGGQVYTINTTTAVPTALGSGIYNGAISAVNYIAFDSSDIVYCMGGDAPPSVWDGPVSTLDLTPNPSYGNALVATPGACSYINSGVQRILFCKGAELYLFNPPNGIIYHIQSGSTCVSPHVVKMDPGASAFSNILAAGGVP